MPNKPKISWTAAWKSQLFFIRKMRIMMAIIAIMKAKIPDSLAFFNSPIIVIIKFELYKSVENHQPLGGHVA